MRRIALAFALALAVSLVLLPGAAGAHHHHRHHGFVVGCCVFIAPVSPFIHHHFFHGFIDPRFGPSLGDRVVVVEPQPVWVPAFWQWTGFQWVWAPGHWIVPSQGLILRNPCD